MQDRAWRTHVLMDGARASFEAPVVGESPPEKGTKLLEETTTKGRQKGNNNELIIRKSDEKIEMGHPHRREGEI